MQKLRIKLNANAVGVAAHSDPLNEKGITLIALIITIIVMLILIGVTINVVLTGGLFGKADEAKKGTVIATEKEQLLNSILGTLDNNGKINLYQIILPNGFKKVSEDSSKVIYEGPSTNQYEVVKTTGKIEEIPKNNSITPQADDVLGLYGIKEYMGVEFLENGKVIFYESNVAVNGEYNATTATFTYNYTNGNGETQIQTITIDYTYEIIKDEGTNETINKILYFDIGGGPMFLTTQKTAGLNLDLYDNKHYMSQNNNHLYFNEGWFEFSVGSLDYYNYCAHKGEIWIYRDDEYAFEKFASINDDGTFVGVGIWESLIGDIYAEVKTTE